MLVQNVIAAAAESVVSFKEPRFDPLKRRQEIAAILEIANRSREGVKRLGAFAFAPARAEDDHFYFPQIRAKPRSGFGDLEFRYNVPARNAGSCDVGDVAGRLLDAARRFDRLSNLAPYAQSLRAGIDRIIEPATHGLMPIRVIALGLNMLAGEGHFELTLDVEMLGDDLSSGIERITGRDAAQLEATLTKLVAKHIAREKVRQLAAASRAIGWIDDFARRVLDESGLSCADAVARLRTEPFLEFNFGGDEGFDFSASLTWEDGVIQGGVRRGGDWEFAEDRLTVLRELIAEPEVAVPGNRFGRLFKQPFIPADALIIETAESGDWLYLKMVVGTALIDEATREPRAQNRVE